MLFQPAASGNVPASVRPRYFSAFDLFAFAVVFGLLAMFTHGTDQALIPISEMEKVPISLDPWSLPEYALRTTLRMLAAIVASLQQQTGPASVASVLVKGSRFMKMEQVVNALLGGAHAA